LNNQIVFVPTNQTPQTEWHLYDCRTKTILSYPRPDGTFASWAYIGGVYDPMNNQIAFVPAAQASQTQWHTFQNFGLPQIPSQLAAHYLFNKF
jgi:hypothetical protein